MAKISGLVWAEFSHEQLVSWQFSMGKSDRLLVRHGLTTATEIEQRATSALAGYIGGQAMLHHNLRDAVSLAREAEANHR
jgi:hypothetical protein